MKAYRTLVCLGLLGLNACGKPTEESSEPKYVLGNDDRVSVNIAETPWMSVGRVTMKHSDGKTYGCTGTLIGKNVVLTAAHCLYKNGVQASTIEFSTQYEFGSFTDKAKVTKVVSGSTQPQSNWAKDWALLKLDKNLGTTFGYLGVWGAAAEGFTFPFTVDLAGYSSDAADGETLSAHLGCKFLSVIKTPKNMAGTIDHDCDLETGASGGPLIAWYNNKPYVAAVQSYHYAPIGGKIGNGAVGTDAALKALATF